ncbi:hypothetical protein J3R82DRAFT_4750 [Butyriboletus roseoflavus]|nr:hypothetical protein J3R82DRAFT_4750 [Butyriboletus roseoflavus]
MKLGHVERAISNPITMKLSVDPRGLDFVVFAFPPRVSLPTNSLFHLRVWLRTAGVDHRIFGEKDLWFGRDPDFRAITDATFATLRNAAQNILIYQAIVGRAHVSFIVRSRSPFPPLHHGLSQADLYDVDGNPSNPVFTRSHSITKPAARAEHSLKTTI